MRQEHRPVLYLGFNDPREHVRGTENVIRVQAQATRGPRYYIFRGARNEAFRWDGMVAISCPRSLPAAGFYIRRLACRIARKHGVAPLIHGHSYLLAAVTPARPLVFTVHDALAYLKRSFGSRFVWIFRLIELWVYWRASGIHAVSHYAWSQACGRSIFGGKLTVIPNSLPREVTPSPNRGESVHAGTPLRLLVVRSIEPRANLDLVVALARHYVDTGVQASITVAGKGPLLEHYRELTQAQGLHNLQFLGYVPQAELEDLYSQASCVIMPALYGEGFGLPLIEAYSRGVPAVGSLVCAVPEVVPNPTLMFDGSVASLLTAIEHAIRLPADYYLRHFQARFARDQVIEQYSKLYLSVQ